MDQTLLLRTRFCSGAAHLINQTISFLSAEGLLSYVIDILARVILCFLAYRLAVMDICRTHHGCTVRVGPAAMHRYHKNRKPWFHMFLHAGASHPHQHRLQENRRAMARLPSVWYLSPSHIDGRRYRPYYEHGTLPFSPVQDLYCFQHTQVPCQHLLPPSTPAHEYFHMALCRQLDFMSLAAPMYDADKRAAVRHVHISKFTGRFFNVTHPSSDKDALCVKWGCVNDDERRRYRPRAYILLNNPQVGTRPGV